MKDESRACLRAKGLAIMAAVVAVTVSLSGCAMAMLDGAARSARSGSTTAGTAGRPASQLAADNVISNAVRSRLGANASLKPLNLIVSTHDGVVTLRGRVNTVQQRNAAQLEARAVKGVRAVKNELTVR